MNKLASIIILTYNSAKYIENCLQSVFNQTYKDVEVIVVDNNSKDDTIKIVREIQRELEGKFKEGLKIILNNKNLGYAGGNNIGIRESRGEYVIIVNPDVVLDENFIKEIINNFENDSKVGSVQGKVYQLNNGEKTNVIDTVGFGVFDSGRIIDLGQGESDNGQYDNLKGIFGVNGVVPAYRRIALNDIRYKEEYLDKDFFCYVEDLDLAWRLNHKGWISIFNPKAVAWHDRTSSKSIGGGWKEFRKTRKSQSLWMCRVSWRNMWLAFIKNLPLKSFFHPQFLKRQIKFCLYLLFFEPKVLLAKFQIIKLLPRTLKKRKFIMRNKKANYVRFN